EAHPDGDPALGHSPYRQLLRRDEADPGHAGEGRSVRLPGRPPRPHLASRRGRHAGERARGHRGLPGLRAGPGKDGVLAPVRHPGPRGADVDPQHAHAQAHAGAGRVVQGQGGAGDRRQRRPLHLPRPPGGRHPPVRLRRRPRGPRPAAAPGDDARHRGQVQRRVRRHLQAPRRGDQRRSGRRAGAGRAQDEQELRQHAGALPGREADAQEGDEHRHRLHAAGGAQGPRGLQHPGPLPPRGLARAGGEDGGRLPRRRHRLRRLQEAPLRVAAGVLRPHARPPRRDPGAPRLRGRGAGRGRPPRPRHRRRHHGPGAERGRAPV
ncbi:MAG: Tryptophanyl-tRNA synthetase, partial [uncultured Gemmatimonadetes bacterium]